jgi:Leucine-rich repeat (LRR) protein
LEELQICSNNYKTIAPDYKFQHEHLRRLYISNNHLTEWQSLCRLGHLFPRLQTLIASENPLQTFHSDTDDVSQCLSHLRTLSVDQVQINRWDDIVALTKIPCLHALRIHAAPLLTVCVCVCVLFF